MADEPDRKKRASINTSVAVQTKLNAYIEVLDRGKYRTTSQGDLIEALLDGVPLWQANLMLASLRPPSDSTDTVDSN